MAESTLCARLPYKVDQVVDHLTQLVPCARNRRVAQAGDLFPFFAFGRTRKAIEHFAGRLLPTGKCLGAPLLPIGTVPTDAQEIPRPSCRRNAPRFLRGASQRGWRSILPWLCHPRQRRAIRRWNSHHRPPSLPPPSQPLPPPRRHQGTRLPAPGPRPAARPGD